MSRTRVAVLFGLVVGLCLSGAAAGGGAVAVDADEHDPENGTVDHEHPDEAGDDGDLDGVQRWLEGRMTEIHVDCAADLSVGESAACERLDGEYPDYLRQYGSIERDRTGGSESRDAFEETRDRQRQLAEENEAFSETYEEYRAAREAGDEERARDLARELRTRAERIAELGAGLDGRLADLENRTGRDLSGAREATNETVARVGETTTEVEAETFTPTTLTADAESRTASFEEPALVTGRLTDENGTALAGRELAVVVDDRTVATTRTDAEGRYEATYRPVTTTAGPTDVAVVYEPTGDGAYLGTSATATVLVRAVEPDVTLETDAERVAFRDEVSVAGEVTVDGSPVAGVLVAVFLGEERLGTGRTDDGGRVDLAASVPATVPDGTRELRLVASEAGLALSRTEAGRSVVVEETGTELTIEGLLDGEALVLGGQLTTADGEPIPDQEVRVDVDAEVRDVSATGADGRYEVAVDRDVGSTYSWAVAADFDGEGTNLASAEVSRRLDAGSIETTEGTTLPGGTPGRLYLTLRRNWLGVAVFALAALVVAVPAYLARRDDGTERVGDTASAAGEAEADAGPSTGGAEPSADEGAVAAGPTDDVGPEPLEFARRRLAAGAPGEAVEAGYGAVRRGLGDGGGGPDARTHWEFHRDLEGTLPEEGSRALRAVTEAYERATFAPTGVDETTAASAIEAAEACLDAAAVGPDG